MMNDVSISGLTLSLETMRYLNFEKENNIWDSYKHESGNSLYPYYSTIDALAKEAQQAQ